MNPVAEWNDQLAQCRVDLELKKKRERRLSHLDLEIQQKKAAVEECLKLLQKERNDVEKLASSSFSHFWLGLIGKLDERLGMEEKEAAEAKLKHDAAAAALMLMVRERAELIPQLAEVSGAEIRLANLKKEKEAWILAHDQVRRAELERRLERNAHTAARLAEAEEALRAGTCARESLLKAKDRLGSAKNWGTYDMIGGGMISTMIKHGRIDEANDHIHEAQHHLRRFAEELKDLDMRTEAGTPQIGSFLKFSDYFFDGLIADWMVQGRIHESFESVDSNLQQVDETLQQLKRLRYQLDKETAAGRLEYEKLVEEYGV